MSNPADEQLIAEVLAGSEERFTPLVERYQGQLFRYAYGMVGDRDAASDLAQDALVTAYRKLATCQQPDRFASWLFRILGNRCRDFLKDKRQQTVPLDTFQHEADSDTAERLASVEIGTRIEGALLELPEAQREAFLLKHVEELSYDEMAERSGASISALKMRVMRAREALQELLADLS